MPKESKSDKTQLFPKCRNLHTRPCRRAASHPHRISLPGPASHGAFANKAAKCTRRCETPLAGYYKSIPHQDSWGTFSKELASQQLAWLKVEQFIRILGGVHGSVLHCGLAFLLRNICEKLHLVPEL